METVTKPVSLLQNNLGDGTTVLAKKIIWEGGGN